MFSNHDILENVELLMHVLVALQLNMDFYLLLTFLLHGKLYFDILLYIHNKKVYSILQPTVNNDIKYSLWSHNIPLPMC